MPSPVYSQFRTDKPFATNTFIKYLCGQLSDYRSGNICPFCKNDKPTFSHWSSNCVAFADMRRKMVEKNLCTDRQLQDTDWLTKLIKSARYTSDKDEHRQKINTAHDIIHMISLEHSNQCKLLELNGPNVYHLTFPLHKNIVGHIVKFKCPHTKKILISKVVDFKCVSRYHTLSPATLPALLNENNCKPHRGRRRLNDYHENMSLEVFDSATQNFIQTTFLASLMVSRDHKHNNLLTVVDNVGAVDTRETVT